MADELEKAKCAVEGWRLGLTSARYESSGRGAGVISTGRGDHGGVSYGEYQLSYSAGTLEEYLGQSSYREQFLGLTPATQGFNDKWREIARTDPAFAQDQHDFIGRTHFDEQNERLKNLNIDLSDRGRSVQDAIWSTSVQFRNLTPRIFDQGLQEKFGSDYKLSNLSDYDIVSAVQDYKLAHNNSLFRSSPNQWPGLLSRARSEKTALTLLALNESVLAMSGQLQDWRSSVASPQMPDPLRDSEQFGQRIQQGAMTFHTPITNGLPDYLRVSSGQRRMPTHQHVQAPTQALAPKHNYTPPPPAEPAALLSLPTTQAMEPGDRGAAVQALQQHLRLLGATDRYGQKIEADRDYGDRTRDAVEQFQLWTGREPTGIADPDTLKAVQSQAQFALRQRGHGIVVAPDAHLTDHLRPTALERTDAAIERPVQGRDQAGLTPFSDPHHPQHALYADVQQRFQVKGHDLSEAQLSALTGQMHLGGYKPGWPGDVIVYQGKAVVGNEYLARQMMSVELNASTPSVQEAMQTFQAEHQSLAQHMERMNQQQAMAQEHGRTV